MSFESLYPSLLKIQQDVQSHLSLSDLIRSQANELIQLQNNYSNNLANALLDKNGIAGIQREYAAFLSATEGIAGVMSTANSSLNPFINLQNEIHNALNSVVAVGDIINLSPLHQALGEPFMRFTESIGEIYSNDDYATALDFVTNNEEVQAIIKDVAQDESLDLEAEESYKSFETHLGEKLYKITGIDKKILSLILFLVLIIVTTVGKKEIENVLYGNSTAKIVESVESNANKVIAYTDSSFKHLSDSNKQAKFILVVDRECVLLDKNSLRGKYLHTLKKGTSVVASSEFRKWTYITVVIPSGEIRGYVQSKYLKEQ
jgi:hypothetical protein